MTIDWMYYRIPLKKIGDFSDHTIKDEFSEDITNYINREKLLTEFEYFVLNENHLNVKRFCKLLPREIEIINLLFFLKIFLSHILFD